MIENINCTTEFKPSLWQKNEAICGGHQTVLGSRIKRTELKRLKQSYSLREIKEMYPWIPDENIEQA